MFNYKMILFYILICFSLVDLSLTKSSEYKSYKDYKVYEVKGHKDGRNKLMNILVENYEIPVHKSTNTSCQMLVAPELGPIVEGISKREGLSAKIVINDYSEIIKMEKMNMNRNNGFSWTAYYDVDDIYKYLTNVSQEYSDSSQLIVGGKSYEGRQILGLRINTPTRSNKPAMFIESGIHAREWITPATTTYFINQLLTSTDPNIVQLRNEIDWHIFPTVNPDGYHYTHTRDRMWRKTRSRSTYRCSGADPNRNWDYNWGNFGSSSDPCNYQTYAGAQAFSEIETRSLSEYISSVENMIGYIAFHADAQMLLLPYSDSTEHHDNYDDLKQIGETSLRYGYEVNKEKYDGPATAAEILYAVSGGSMDWVRYSQGTSLVYTYELRGMWFHWPPSRINEQGDEVTQMLLGLVTEARNLGYL